jgi:ammonium transporter Rh
MGAILGKVSVFQLFSMANFHIFFFTVNKAIILRLFKASDKGGSMIIHMFGAYFGIAMTWFFQPKVAKENKNKLGQNNYLSDLISMAGTLFLFCYWPSWNAAQLEGGAQMRAYFNTYLAISSSVIAAILVSRVCYGRKLEMRIMLNASLAGGVFMGANAEIMVMPYGPMLGGFLVGVIASFGYAFIAPFLRNHLNLHDTCGVHNLFGLPGFCGGIVSSIIAAKGPGNFDNYYDQTFFNQSLRTASVQAGF